MLDAAIDRTKKTTGEEVLPRLTEAQFDRLRWCADGNTLRFEAAEIVAALVAGGYAVEGIGRVVKVTPKGQQYLGAHAIVMRRHGGQVPMGPVALPARDVG